MLSLSLHISLGGGGGGGSILPSVYTNKCALHDAHRNSLGQARRQSTLSCCHQTKRLLETRGTRSTFCELLQTAVAYR